MLKKALLYIIMIFISLGCWIIPANNAKAGSSTATYGKVHFIYIQGVKRQDSLILYDEVKKLHSYFKGNYIQRGNKYYKITDEINIVNWGEIVRDNQYYQLMDESIDQTNMINNEQHSVLALFNPFSWRFFPVYDNVWPKTKYNGVGWKLYRKGTDAQPAAIRQYIYDFVYDMDAALYFNSPSHPCKKLKEDIYDKISQKIEDQYKSSNNDDKYIIVGYSAGSVISFLYLTDVIIPQNDKRFLGLITFGSLICPLLPDRLVTEFQNYKECQKTNCQNSDNLFDFLIKNDAFWVQYGHRNDTFATLIPNNMIIKGYIDSDMSKGNNKEVIWDKLNVFKVSDSSFIKAHLWYLSHSNELATEIFKLLQKNSNQKK